eukprot:s6937_g2.t1
MVPLSNKRRKRAPAETKTVKEGQNVQELQKLLKDLASDPQVVARRDAAPVVLPRRKRLRLYSDCAGMGCDLVALTLCGLAKHCHLVGWSEIDEGKRKLHNLVRQYLQFPGDEAEGPVDVSSRDHERAKACDIYVAGFPCPSFSSLGKGAGDKEFRGQLTYHGLLYVCYHQPRIVVLENVQGLLHKRHAGLTNCIKETLASLGYKVYCKTLNTMHYGIPQSRPRVFIVAVQEKYKKHKFRWPAPIEHSKKALGFFLDTQTVGDDDTVDLFKFTSKFGEDVYRKSCVLDVGCSARWANFKAGVAPCLTKSRLNKDPLDFYIPRLRRRLNLGEAARLQGLPRALAKTLVRGTSKKIFGSAVGDGMSVNVLCKVFLAALHCIGYIESATELDPWQETATGSSLADAADIALKRQIS